MEDSGLFSVEPQVSHFFCVQSVQDNLLDAMFDSTSTFEQRDSCEAPFAKEPIGTQSKQFPVLCPVMKLLGTEIHMKPIKFQLAPSDTCTT
jgi:hypothetical protein